MNDEDDEHPGWALLTPLARVEHRVKWQLETERVEATFECGGDGQAFCRNICGAGLDCEAYPCRHAPVSYTCVAVEWLSMESGADTYDGDGETALRDGPIVLVWDGDGYLWHYRDPA